MSAAGQRWVWVLLAAWALFRADGPAAARYAPLQTTPAGLADRVAEAIEFSRTIGPSLGLSDQRLAALSQCSSVEADIRSGDLPRLQACRGALAEVYRDLAFPEESDPLRRGARWFLARGIADAAFRVTSAGAAAAAGHPGALAPSPGVPAQILVLSDGRTLRIRPLRPLRPGRRWSLVLSGLTPDERAYARGTVVPKDGSHGLEVTEGSLVERVVAGLGDDPSNIDRAAAIALARRIEQDVQGRAGTSPSAGVQLRLPEALRPQDLGRLVARFVPARVAPTGESIVELPVVDIRRSLSGILERIATLPCPKRPGEDRPDLRAKVKTGGARIVEGVYPSLRIGRERDGRLQEVAADAASTMPLPYLLALPSDVGPDTPLVLAVHGHGGRASKFLTSNADGLLSRGLAVLAVELPEHGARGARPKEFLGVLDPARLRVNYRQALVDLLAALRAATTCGFPLPDGSTYRPKEVRYFGYSLGSLLGVSLRALAPALGPAVLAAPAGDLAGWLMLHLPTYLDAPALTCLGGPEHGRECLADRSCAAPGVCWLDPYYARVAFLFDLPFGLVLADAEPLGPARVRTGEVSKAPVLLLTAGNDGVLYSLLQARLADAYDMHGEPPGSVRGPRSERRHWPTLEHDLLENEEVRTTAYDFLAASGHPRSTPRAGPPANDP